MERRGGKVSLMSWLDLYAVAFFVIVALIFAACALAPNLDPDDEENRGPLA